MRLWTFVDYEGHVVIVRDRTSMEYRGTVRNVFSNAVVLANGDGTATVIDLDEIVSVRILGAQRGPPP